MEKIKILFKEDYSEMKKNQEYEATPENAKYFVEDAKVAVYVKEITEEEIEAKYGRDKFCLDDHPSISKAQAMHELKVTSENYDRWKEKTLLSDKKEDDNEQEISELHNLKISFLKYIKNKNIAKATEILVDYIKENNYLYTTKNDNKSEMWTYQDGIYIPHGKSYVKEILRNILEEWYSNFYVNIVLSKIETDTYIDEHEFFKINYKNEVPVLNGLLNVFTRELNTFNPDKIFFNKIPIEYNKEATCPLIEGFLEDVLAKKEDKEVYFEIGGFALLKEYKYEKAFMFHGNGRNGKGKAIDLLRRSMGISNCVSVPLASLKPESFQISELFGKMLNLAGDLSNTDLKDTGMFKSLTGRDLVNGKRKFLNDISFENFAKFIFACNDLPMVYDTSKGFWDRWVLLDFPYYFADKERYELTKETERINWKIRDDDILNKITTPTELSGLLNKFLDGLDRIIKNGKFSYAEGCEEIKIKWIRKANSFIAFCIDNIEEDYEGRISKKELRNRYTHYCKQHKVNGKSDIVLKATLQEMYGASDTRHYISGLNDVHEWFWEGIKWK